MIQFLIGLAVGSFIGVFLVCAMLVLEERNSIYGYKKTKKK